MCLAYCECTYVYVTEVHVHRVHKMGDELVCTLDYYVVCVCVSVMCVSVRASDR